MLALGASCLPCLAIAIVIVAAKRATAVRIVAVNCTGATLRDIELLGTEADGEGWPNTVKHVPPYGLGAFGSFSTSEVSLTGACISPNLYASFSPYVMIGSGDVCVIQFLPDSVQATVCKVDRLSAVPKPPRLYSTVAPLVSRSP